MTIALTYKELAEYLGYSPETIKKVWKRYPHYFAGSGRTLKSARFDLHVCHVLLGGHEVILCAVRPLPSGRGYKALSKVFF
jgi:hypothetical protein